MLLVQSLLRYQFTCKAYLGIDHVNVLVLVLVHVNVNVNVPEGGVTLAEGIAWKAWLQSL